MAPYETTPPQKRPETGYYHHYKHDPQKGVRDYAYFILGVGHHTEEDCRPEDQFMQVYLPLYESFVYKNGKMLDLRPLHMYAEPAQWKGKEVERFTRITDPAVIAELKAVRNEMYSHLFD